MVAVVVDDDDAESVASVTSSNSRMPLQLMQVDVVYASSSVPNAAIISPR
jgi:hypothetical protein